MNYIYTLKDHQLKKQDIGGKAYSLYLLGRAQLHNVNIPQWFVIKEGTQQLIQNSESEKINFEKELTATLDSFDSNTMWAVRSSASQEDGSKNSFAGQLDTFLYISKETLLENITKVWNSIGSDHFQQYCQERNIVVDKSPAVLVQMMVASESSGVGFGINPVTHEKEFVINAIHGLGDLLVSGDVSADNWIVKNGQIKETNLAEKTILETYDHSAKQLQRIPNAKEHEASLTEKEIIEVSKVLQEANKFYGHPQDIEWALHSGKIYLLQSRPITTVNSGTEILWDNSNIAESYGGVTTPLTFSFAKKAYENVYRQLCVILKIDPKRIDNNDVVFRNMLGLIKGRVYYNMNSWYKTLALLPGFSLNKTFMEQMMGVKEQMSPELHREIKQNLTNSKTKDIKNLAVALTGMLSNLFKLDSTVKNFYKRLDIALANKNLSKMNSSELINYYNHLELSLLKKWDAPMVNDLFAMIFYGLLRKLSKKWCHDEDESFQNSLILMQGGIISAEPARLMKEIAKKIKDLGIWHDDFNTWSNQVKSSVIQPDIDRYIEVFGDRCLDELKLESLTLLDNPELLYKTLYELVQYQDLSDNTIQDNTNKNREQELIKKLPKYKQWIFKYVMNMARKTVKERENLRFERTRLFGRVRRIFLTIGQRFVEENIINEQRDIFYLEVGEIQSFIEGTSTLTNLKELISLRKIEFQNFEQETPPADRFSTLGIVYKNNPYLNTTAPILLEGDMQKGLGCCPGVVRAKVKVVRDPKNVTLEKGVILVAERTDPGWIMLFPSASAILVEKGSLLSHAAIVSRELNLPSVVNVPGLLNWLQDDDIVEIDGTTGTIRKIKDTQ